MKATKILRWSIGIIAVLLLVLLLFPSPRKRPGQIGRIRLPVGSVTPQIGFGFEHGIIVAGDGSLWSWGGEGLGWPVLGREPAAPQPGLRQIGAETNWAQIAVGSSHNLALKSDGTIWAWGENIRGQLGDGIKARRQNKPVPSVPGNDWKQIAAGAGHSLAQKLDGTLWAWGLNNFGELGISSTRDGFVATQVGTATNWIKIRAGGSQSAGIQSDGSLWIWGSSPTLGNTRPQSIEHFLVPTRVSTDTNWVDMTMSMDVGKSVWGTDIDRSCEEIHLRIAQQVRDAKTIRRGERSLDQRAVAIGE